MEKNNIIIVCAEIENQIMELDEKDRKYFIMTIWN